MKVSIILPVTLMGLVFQKHKVAGSPSSRYALRATNATKHGEGDSVKNQQSISRRLAPLNGFGGNPPVSAFPLKLCQGDCDKHEDCEGNLVCFQRDRFEPVPGCFGNLASKTDYCVDARNTVSSPPPPRPTSPPANNGNGGGSVQSGSDFLLKLYWEQGYTWQDETIERRWCMMYRHEGNKRINGQCWYGRDKKPCRPDQVYIDQCKNDDRQKFHFARIGNTDEVLIVSSGSGPYTGLCMQREREREIFLRLCDSNNPRQRWYAIRGGFDERRFEISQRIDEYRRDLCITQMHHPKDGEVVELMSCNLARSDNHQTSWWNKY